MTRILPIAAVVLAVLAAAGACSSGFSLPPPPGLGASSDALTFAQVQAIQPGLTVAQVRDAYGEPKRESRRADGTVERMEYGALDARNGKNSLFLDFDARGSLTRKTFTGAILRP